jgi:hypothetical protein
MEVSVIVVEVGVRVEEIENDVSDDVVVVELPDVEDIVVEDADADDIVALV